MKIKEKLSHAKKTAISEKIWRKGNEQLTSLLYKDLLKGEDE